MTGEVRHHWLMAAGVLIFAAGGASAQEFGVDRPGGDLKPGFDLAAADPALCQQACDADPACKAWTYVKPGVQGPSARCWIKSSVPAAVKSECCVSGVRDTVAAHRPVARVPQREVAGVATVSPTMSGAALKTVQTLVESYSGYEIGIDRPGSDFRDFVLDDARPDICRAACDADSACIAFTFVRGGLSGTPKAHCWLKTAAPAKRLDANCISGLRTRTASRGWPLQWTDRDLSATAGPAFSQATGIAAVELVAKRPLAEVNKEFLEKQRVVTQATLRRVRSERAPPGISMLASRPEVLALVAVGVPQTDAELRITEMTRAHGTRVGNVGLAPSIENAVSLASQGPLNTIDEGGALFLYGRGFGDVPGRIRLIYHTQKHDFGPVTPHSIDLIPLTGDWASSWANDLISVRVAPLAEPWREEQERNESPSIFLFDPSPMLEVTLGNAPTVVAQKPVRLVRHGASLGSFVALPQWQHPDRTVRNAITAGGVVAIYGEELGTNGQARLIFKGDVTPFNAAAPLTEYVFGKSDIVRWSDTEIVLNVPETLQGNYAFVPALLSVQPSGGNGLASYTGGWFGPKMELYYSSGQEFFEFEDKDDADRAIVSGALMTVFHNPGCSSWNPFTEGNWGIDRFFSNKPLPPNAAVHKAVIVEHRPGDPDMLGLTKAAVLVAETAANVLSGDWVNLALDYGGVFFGAIFGGGDYGKYGVTVTPSNENPSIAVEWHNTCAKASEREGQEVIYTATFVIKAPAGTIDLGPQASVITD